MTHAHHSSSVRCTDQIQFHTPNHSQVRASHAGQFHNLLVDPRATLSFAPVRTHHLAETSATHAHHSSSVRRTDQIQFHTPNHSQVRALHAGQFRNLLVDPRASLSFAPVRTHHLAETSATHAHHSSSVRRTDQIQFHIHSHSPVRASHAGFPTTYSSTRVRRSRLHHYGRTISRRRVRRSLAMFLACVALTKFSSTFTATHRSERRTRVFPQPTRRPACDALVCTITDAPSCGGACDARSSL